MELFYIEDKNKLDSLAETADFLQSWTWGEIAQADGQEIKRLGWREDAPTESLAETVAAATLIKTSLAGGLAYWYSPRGPLFDTGDKEKLSESFKRAAEDIKSLDKKIVFWRFEPNDYRFIDERDKTGEFLKYWSTKGLKVIKTKDVQPSQTLFLDLSLSDEELLKGMHQKTRYNLRLAEKKGVTVSWGKSEDLQEFWRLMRLTGQRDSFRLHSLKHYRNLLSKGEGKIRLLLASYKGETIAAGLFSFNKLKTTYLHGASDNKYRNVMAPYLLQWTAIKDGKKNGSHYYDFYGVDEKKWPGVTRFKLGFGGRRILYPGTYDVVFRPVIYKLYQFWRHIRRII